MGRNANRAGKLVTVVGMFGLAACTAQYKNHGYVPDEAALSKITVGVTTRDAVVSDLGTPSTSGVLKDGGLYYVRSRVRTFAASKPKVVSREIVAISFDKRGVVSAVGRFGLQHGKIVPLDRNVTETGGGSDNTLLRQLIGSLGNFDAASMLGGE